jgi:hypothetical protein
LVNLVTESTHFPVTTRIISTDSKTAHRVLQCSHRQHHSTTSRQHKARPRIKYWHISYCMYNTIDCAGNVATSHACATLALGHRCVRDDVDAIQQGYSCWCSRAVLLCHSVTVHVLCWVSCFVVRARCTKTRLLVLQSKILGNFLIGGVYLAPSRASLFTHICA